MIVNKNNVIDYLKEKQSYFYNRFNIEIIGVFGSVARDEATNTSDIDILYTTPKDIKNLYDKKQKLKEELQKYFFTKIDLASIKYLKPYAKDIIMNDLVYVK